MTDDEWTITTHHEPHAKDATLIEGLPGIGNAGKVVVDFILEQTEATKVASFFAPTLPNTVFVNEDNLVELPKIELYHATLDGKDYLLLTGDVQPSDERSSYAFSNALLDKAEASGAKRIITLGGIGLQEEPKDPTVYCTGNDETYIKRFLDQGASKEVYGTVGPIIGVSGLLLGLAKQRHIPAVALLVETLGHPMYLGLKGAKAVMQLLMKTIGFELSLKDLDDEITQMEKDEEPQKHKLKSLNKLKRAKDTNYIG